jgi:hypothetical protein
VTVSLSPEYAVLLDAIAPTDRPRADAGRMDSAVWSRLLRAADWHRLAPALYCHLNEQPWHVPAGVIDTLHRAYMANAARNMFIASSLTGALDALSLAEVPVVLLKGAALIEAYYADPAQRELLDLDLLVPAERLGAATAALAPLGYRSAHDEEGIRGTPQSDQHHDPPLVGEEELVAVELHRHITIGGEGAGFDINELWQRARLASRGDHFLPGPEDLLLHVCFHFTRNRLGGSYQRRNTGGALAQVFDIARVVAGSAIDWRLLVDITHRYGLGARVFLALFAARELGVAVPDEALAGLRPSGCDPALGRRFVELRVLRGSDHIPVRSARWLFAPNREALERRWGADPGANMSLARAYVRRARAHAPLARSALRRPWLLMQDYRLNDQIHALEAHD